MVRKGPMVQQARKGHTVILALLVRKDLRVRSARRGLRVHLVRLVRQVRKAHKDWRDRRVRKDRDGPRVRSSI